MRQRYFWAITASLLLHTLVASPMFLGFNPGLDIPDFELEFETVDMVDLVAPDQEQAEIEAPVSEPDPGAQTPPDPPEKTEEDDDGSTQEEETTTEEKPKRKLGDQKSRVDKLGPANSRIYALLATRRVAKLPYAEEAIELMAPWPDFEFIVRGAGFHPFRDFNAIAIASSDFRDATQTFLAVDSRLPAAELRAGIERAARRNGESVVWETRQGITVGNPKPTDPSKPDWDPRYFAFIDDRTAVYVREEFLPSIIAGPDEKKGKTSGNFVANIARLRSFIAREPDAGVQLVIKDIRASLKSAKWPFAFDIPNGFEVFAGATAEPELVIRIEFLTERDAKYAQSYWENELGDMIKSSIAYMYIAGPIYSSTEVEQDDKTLTLRNRFTTGQAKLLLQELAKLSARQMRKSPEEMESARTERQAMWKRRKGGRLPPSKALETPPPNEPAAGNNP